jgi:hypothetical protein
MKAYTCGGYRKIPIHFNPGATWKRVVSFPRQHYPGKESLVPTEKGDVWDIWTRKQFLTPLPGTEPRIVLLIA